MTQGMEVRNAHLSKFSKEITIEEAFENFFDNRKWTQYDSEGYINVVFTGVCEYSGERADRSPLRLLAKILLWIVWMLMGEKKQFGFVFIIIKNI